MSKKSILVLSFAIFLQFTSFGLEASEKCNFLERIFYSSKVYRDIHEKVIEKIRNKNTQNYGWLGKIWLKEDLIPRIQNPEVRSVIFNKVKNREALSSHEVTILDETYQQQFLPAIRLKETYYKKRFLGGDKRIPITFGLEFEVTLQENPKIVNAYRPKDISEKKWTKLQFEERVKIAKEVQEGEQTLDAVFIKLSGVNSLMPKNLYLEPHGTIEGNEGLVFSTLGELNDFLIYFVDNFDSAYFQGHNVYPNFAEVKGVAGYAVFESDYGQLKTLEKNYKRYLDDSLYIPAKTLVHPSLNPLSENTKMAFQRYEIDANSGLSRPKKVFKSRVINGPSFRMGSPYKEGFVGIEFRQFHKDYEGLITAMNLHSWELENHGNLKRFEKYTKVEAISTELTKKIYEFRGASGLSQEDIEYFLLKVSDELKSMAQKRGSVLQGDTEPFERLLFALRAWRKHPILDNLKSSVRVEVGKRIEEAQDSFLEGFIEVIRNSNLNEVTQSEVRKLQVLNSKFSSEANLSQYFLTERFAGISPHDTNVSLSYHSLLLDRDFLESYKEYEVKGKKVKVPVYRFHDVPRSLGFLPTVFQKKLIKQLKVKENLVQFIFSEDHTYLGVGASLYSFYGSGAASITSNLSFPGESYAFYLSRKQVRVIKDELEDIFYQIRRHGLPYFSSMPGKVEIKRKEGISSKVFVGEREDPIQADLMERDGELVLETPGEYREKVIEENGKLYIPTYNCTSLVSSIVDNYSIIGLGVYVSPVTMKNSLEKGIKRIPDLIIKQD